VHRQGDYLSGVTGDPSRTGSRGICPPLLIDSPWAATGRWQRPSMNLGPAPEGRPARSSCGRLRLDPRTAEAGRFPVLVPRTLLKRPNRNGAKAPKGDRRRFWPPGCGRFGPRRGPFAFPVDPSPVEKPDRGLMGTKTQRLRVGLVVPAGLLWRHERSVATAQ